jgi:N-acyl-L-homoserine lactone synthetase
MTRLKGLKSTLMRDESPLLRKLGFSFKKISQKVEIKKNRLILIFTPFNAKNFRNLPGVLVDFTILPLIP